jgi:hypothetical protein
MENEFIVKTLGQFQGYRTRLKEMHWSSPSMDIHTLTDEMTNVLEGFEDSLAEISIALWGEIKPGDLIVKSSNDYDFRDILKAIHGKAIEIKRCCEEGGLLWSGIGGITDTFIADVEAIIFKTNLSYKTV